MKQMKFVLYYFAGLLLAGSVCAQSNITRVEYYVDTDPGYGNAFNVSITPDTNIINRTIPLNINNIPAGLHAFGIRARNANGGWSLDNKWLFLKPYATDTVRPNLNRIEYYVDTDPGYGNGRSVSFTPGKEVKDAIIPINPNQLTAGLHIFGIRSRDANGKWSLDNKWLFLKPYATDTVAPNLNRIEYYVDVDPGYGNGINIPFTNGKQVADAVVAVDPSTLSPGLHIFGIRSRDAKGSWSLDNKWLFLKPEAPPGPPPNIVSIEYYIDTDPGFGRAVPIAIEAAKEYPNFNVPVNVSVLDTGKHILFIRSKDRNGAWSLDNKYEFRIQPAIPAASIIVNSISKKLICADNTVDVSFDARGIFDSTNVFTVQLSNINGSFSNPRNIGSATGRRSAIITGTIPGNVTPGSGYRIRVISSNVALTSAPGADTLTVGPVLAAPTITANGPTTFCQGGSVQLSSSAATSYLWSNGDTTRTVTINRSGNYRVTITNASGCTATSVPTSVTVNPLPDAIITPSGITTDVCPGQTVTLTASAGTSYLWSTGATTQSIVVNVAGSYTVTVTNANGCSRISAATVVTYLGCARPDSLSASNINTTGARVGWLPVACAVGYQYQWRVKGTATWNSATTVATSRPITALTPATTYQWRVTTGCQVTPDTISSGYISGPEFTTLAAATTYAAGKITVPDNSSLAFHAAVIPNPVKENALLEWSGSLKDARIILTDMTGKILWKSASTKEKQVKLPVSTLAAGIYMVNVYSGKEVRVIKFVKE